VIKDAAIRRPTLDEVFLHLVFGSAITVPGSGDYGQYLVPGLFVMIAVNRSSRW